MNFFDILRGLLFNKKEPLETINNDDLQSFTPYMINRWLSFYDKQKAVFVNETLNKFTSLYEDKSETYRFYHFFIPKLKFKKINYIKKIKEAAEKTETNKRVVMAKNNLVSVREIESYIDFLQLKDI